MAGLPPSVTALAELSPVEDIALYLLRRAMPDVAVQALITHPHPVPSVLVRRTFTYSETGGDPRFLDSADLLVYTFAADPDGDRDAAILAEACRVALRDAWLRNVIAPGLGYLTRVEVRSPPRRVSDWATATGPVQYADLPEGVWRWEAAYSLTIRPHRNR
jgi:hypothetical protein